MSLNKHIPLIILLLLPYFTMTSSLSASNFDNDILSQIKLLSPVQTIDTLIQLSSESFNQDKFQESIGLLQEALIMAEKHPKKYKYYLILYKIGKSHYRNNNYNLAQEYLFKCLENTHSGISLSIKGNVYSVIASTYYNLGDYSLAHEYKLKSIELKEIEKDSFGISGDYYDLGSMFFYENLYEKALEYYNKAKKLALKTGHTRIVYNSTAALGATFERMGDLELSLKLNMRSLAIADSLGYETGKAYSLHNIGSNYIELGKYSQAKTYIQKSMDIKRKLDDRWGMIGSTLALGDLYTRKKQFILAEKNLNKALQLAESLESKGRISEVYLNFSRLYKKYGKKDSTIAYLTKYISLKDSIMNETILREMGDRKSQFAIQKKEYEIELLRKDKTLLESEKKVQQLNSFLAFGVSLFLLLVCVVIYLLLLKQKKMSASLSEKNKEIESQKSKIEVQNRLLESSNEDLKQFAYVASHDLREPLRMINSYGNLIERRYKHKLDESGQEFLFYMTDAAKRMDRLLLDLLAYSRTTRNLETLESVSTKEIMESIQILTDPLIRERNATLEYDESHFPMVMGRKTQLYQVFQNLIMNALKYNINEKPYILVECIKNCENYIFAVRDNGIGIEEKGQKKIFEMFQRLHSKEEFEGSGIGLAICKKIIDAHDGDIWVESQKGKGSTFFFSLPFHGHVMKDEADSFPKLVSLEN